MRDRFLRAATYARQRAFLLGWSLWIALIVEFLSRGALGDTLKWSVTSIHLLLLNGLLILGLLLILVAATGSAKVSYWVVTAVALVVAFVSGVKLRLKGLPLLPWDLGLAREATDVIAWKDVFSIPVLVGILLFIGGSVVLVHRLVKPHGRLGWKEKVALAAAAVCLVGGTYAIPGLARPFDQVDNVQHNGYLLATLWNLRYISTGGLPTQSHEDVAAILDLSGKTAAAAGMDKDAKPNVIVVLSESLFDPTIMKGVTFNQDPMPFFHSLQRRYPSGTMLSPEFAGSTANVELEVLTGLSMKFLPDGVVAYEKYINRPVDSLASILARQGYASTMITPWSHWFFNSQVAYKNLGFGRLISGEFLIQDFDGPYMADREVARAIMDESAKSPGPDFIFANTAQNHYGYWPGKFKEQWISVSGPLSDDSKGILESYAQGCAYADRMLQTLVEHYSASKEPTILVFFGDHLPLLGPKYQVYKEAGYITGESDPDFLDKIYRVPVLVWNNYLPDHQDNISFGSNFLAPYVLNEAKAPSTPFMDFLREQVKRTPIIPARRFWPSVNLTDDTLKEYEALQSDILSGEQKTYSEFRDHIVNPDYTLGYGPFAINKAAVVNGELRVTGTNLPPLSVIHINGKQAPTMWISLGEVRTKAPVSPQDTIDVRVLAPEDSSVVLQSNQLTLSQ